MCTGEEKVKGEPWEGHTGRRVGRKSLGDNRVFHYNPGAHRVG